MAILNVGVDFDKDPSGRYYTDGPASGERFREEFLKPKLGSLSRDEKLEIIIDGEVEGYGSSFLVEGFAGLVKHGYFSKDFLRNRMIIKFSDPDFEFYRDKIWMYIDSARFRSEKYASTKR